MLVASEFFALQVRFCEYWKDQVQPAPVAVFRRVIVIFASYLRCRALAFDSFDSGVVGEFTQVAARRWRFMPQLVKRL